MTGPILPPATIGIIGGGQLGMMAIREAQRMGYRSIVWDPTADCPASRLADETITAPFEDRQAARRLAKHSDVVTYEFEHIDAATVELVSTLKPLYPGTEILKVSQHRQLEKEALQRAGFPVIRYRVVRHLGDVRAAVQEVRFPAVIKTTTAGYDGKGQTVLKDAKDLETFLVEQKGKFRESVVEEFLPLFSEVSVVAVRGKDGRITTFPVVENEHRENILHVTRVPAQVSEMVREQATRLARAVIDHFSLVGVLCIEMFVTQDEEVLVNELAPRPHNSGHYSLDACTLSQFEALVRSVCGLAVPEPRLLSPCAMVNLLGKHVHKIDLDAAQRIPGVKVHLYGKRRIEPKRKMGHVTIVGTTPEEVERTVGVIETMIEEPVRSQNGNAQRHRKIAG